MLFLRINTLVFLILLCRITAAQNSDGGSLTEGDTNDITKANMEREEIFVDYMASEIEKLYQNRQNEIDKCQCSTHTCSTVFPKESKCQIKIRPVDFCYNDKEERIDPFSMGTRLPPGTDPENLSDKLKSSICTFR